MDIYYGIKLQVARANGDVEALAVLLEKTKNREDLDDELRAKAIGFIEGVICERLDQVF